VELLARLMRAEAEGEGDLGMLMVGNVGVNRVRANCLDFKGIRNLQQMVFQRPGVLRLHKRAIFIKERGITKLDWRER
jgi:N-acetylmuramoyl-L-alanine amidase